HEDERHLELGTHALHELEDAAERGAARESPRAGALDRGAVGDGVGERDADLEAVRTGVGEGKEQRLGELEIRIAGRDEGQERALSLRPKRAEAIAEAAHVQCAPSFACARAARSSRTWITSLSPRPERFTRIT